MSKRATAEQALAEAQARAAFKILSGQIESILLGAGWSQAERDGELVPFVRSHGDIIILAGNDAYGHNHSAASRHGLSLAEYLAALDLRLTPEPRPAPVEAPPTPELQSLREQLEAANKRIEELSAKPVSEPVEDVVEFPPEICLLPEDLGQIMAPGETIASAVERMTPGVDELLDMATVLSEASLEEAFKAIPAERINEWTERLNDEKARLRTKRGTDEENLDREKLIDRVKNMFGRVGARR
jgi:hypothetical protein